MNNRGIICVSTNETTARQIQELYPGTSFIQLKTIGSLESYLSKYAKEASHVYIDTDSLTMPDTAILTQQILHDGPQIKVFYLSEQYMKLTQAGVPIPQCVVLPPG